MFLCYPPLPCGGGSPKVVRSIYVAVFCMCWTWMDTPERSEEESMNPEKKSGRKANERVCWARKDDLMIPMRCQIAMMCLPCFHLKQIHHPRRWKKKMQAQNTCEFCSILPAVLRMRAADVERGTGGGSYAT